MYKRQLRQFKKEEIVPTVKADYLRKGKVLQGYVHDESAAFMLSLIHILCIRDSLISVKYLL